MSHPDYRDDTATAAGIAVQREREVVDVTETDSETRPLGELLSQATQDVTTIMRKEVELAKVEIKEEIDQAKKAGVMFGVTGLLGYMALVLLSFAAAWGLGSFMPAGFAFLIVGAIYAIAAGIFFMRAKRAVKEVKPVPEQTIETLKEDVQWAKHPTS